MKKANLKKLFAVLISFVLIAVIALSMTACTDNKQDETPQTTHSTESTTEASAKTKLGEGENQFSFSVTHKDGSIKEFEINTNFKSVGVALSSLKVIDGEEGQYGLYVKTVDGETLDYDTDGMYWAFYENGSYASTGIDQATISDGVKYELKAEK